MRSTITQFLTDRTGATVVEYCMLVAVLSLVIVGGVGNFGNELQNMLIRLGAGLNPP